MEPDTRIGKLYLLARTVSPSGRVSWECKCQCRRLVTVAEPRLTGEHHVQVRACRLCESEWPAGDDSLEPRTADSGETRPVSGGPELVIRGELPGGRFQVKCRCGVQFELSGKMLKGSKRIRRCAECRK